MPLRMLIVLALCALMVQSAQAQTAEIEIIPTDFVPLEVGNQWTYNHYYFNRYYSWRGTDWDPEVQMLFEIPGYPYDSPEIPPDSLLWVDHRELTIEITHTEMIDGSEYFVFSRADYDWPPLPELFWAGQKVRLSSEGVLLFRWNGQDVPLYDCNLQHPSEYSIPAYPIREGIFTKLAIRRQGPRDERQRWITFSVTFPELPFPINFPEDMPSVIDTAFQEQDPIDALLFHFSQPRRLSSVAYITFREGYGLTYGEYYDRSTGWELVPFFWNRLDPISAIISGASVSSKQPLTGNTHVQPSSWGQLKRAFRPR